MKIVKIILLLFFTNCIAQNTPLKIKINAISFNDSNPKKRKYNIEYQIENTTKNDVSFFLTPYTLIAFEASSMTLFPVYKMFHNGKYENMDGPFYEITFIEENEILNLNDYKSTEAKELIDKIKAKYQLESENTIENYKKNGGKETDKDWILKNNELLRSKIDLKPFETKKFVIETFWNKNRFIKNGSNEYYLDEKDTFEIELSLILNKSNRNAFLSLNEFNKVKNDPNFLEGVFVSNKFEIKFNEKSDKTN